MTTTTSSEAPETTPGLGRMLRPLAIDIVVPTATYYLLTAVWGVPLLWALTASSVLPMVRTITSLAVDRRLNMLAALMLGVSVAGIASSFLLGDPRLMIAKDSVVSSVIAFALLLSVLHRQPMMATALEPFITKGEPARVQAWGRLVAGSPEFNAQLGRHTLIWGGSLLIECTVRVVGAFTLPIQTMMWLSPLLVWMAIGAAIILGGMVTGPMERMIRTEIDAAAQAAGLI